MKRTLKILINKYKLYTLINIAYNMILVLYIIYCMLIKFLVYVHIIDLLSRYKYEINTFKY